MAENPLLEKRVAILGSRDYPQLERVEEHVRALARKYPDACVVEGGSRGVCETARRVALACGLGVSGYWVKKRPETGLYYISIVHADPGQALDAGDYLTMAPLEDGKTWKEGGWEDFATPAHKRSTLMINCVDTCVFFWDGASAGTRFEIEEARRMGRQYFVFPPEGS